MRKLIFILFLHFSLTAHSQNGIERFLDSTVKELKKQSPTDKNDMKVFELLESFYNEALQSDKGELTSETSERINNYLTDSSVKNRHMLFLFLMYQDYISNTAGKGKKPDGNFQVACINRLEKEMLDIYKKVPTIVYIFKAEALESAGRKEEAKNLVSISLQKLPHSIPLKVYRFLDTKDENLRLDLVNNHSGHWMVKQFGIK